MSAENPFESDDRRQIHKANHSRENVRYAVVGLGYISQAAVLPAFANAKENSELVALDPATIWVVRWERQFVARRAERIRGSWYLFLRYPYAKCWNTATGITIQSDPVLASPQLRARKDHVPVLNFSCAKCPCAGKQVVFPHSVKPFSIPGLELPPVLIEVPVPCHESLIVVSAPIL
jgi:hypothetical protein